MAEHREWLEADPLDFPQEEAVELPGAVQHHRRGERDGRTQRRIHLQRVQWADGEECLGLSQSVW